MKKFLLFAGADYYADGGWNDFHGSFDTVAEAEAIAASLPEDSSGSWWHVVDALTGAWCAGSQADRIGAQSRERPAYRCRSPSCYRSSRASITIHRLVATCIGAGAIGGGASSGTCWPLLSIV